jgi:hypothetical protein
MTAACPKALAELSALLGRHFLPTAAHAGTVASPGAKGAAEAPKQKPAQGEQAKGLPEADYRQSKDLGHQVIPQLPHGRPEAGDKDDGEQQT